MQIVHWNFSKVSSPMSGIKRYEDELFNNLKCLYPYLGLERFPRREGELLGNIPASWVFHRSFGKPDLIHATFQTLAPGFKFSRHLNYVITVHDLIPLVYSSTLHDFSTRLQWWATPNALKKANHVIADSQFTKEELTRLLGIQPEKISVVYLGIDHTLYHPLDKAPCKKQFKFDPAKKYVLVVASNERHKRMDLVVKILGEIKRQRRDIEFVKIGYGQLLERAEIINPGWVKEEAMPALYNAADVYLHTSEYEGFGLPVLEAMACGTPVVASKKASIPEIMGDCDRLIDLEQNDPVPDFIKAILQSIEKGSNNQALERSKSFTWEKTAEETCQVYRRIAGR
jgi:glycosyltransferase involved in cell wall biosynthesis